MTDEKIAHRPSSAVEDDIGEHRQSYRQQRSNIMETIGYKTKVEQSQVEKIVRGKNIDSIRLHSYGPHSYVFFGRHVTTGRMIRVKVLLREDIEKAGGFVLKRNFPESQLYSDDRLAKMYEIFPSGKILLILNDFYKSNLSKLLMDNVGPLPENLVRTIFQGVIQAFNHMHLNKIAHRNLKLENILLDKDNRPVIADYNYTIVVENIENFNRLLAHSMPYLAPEILDRHPYDPICADVWTLGICLYTVLHDAFPFIPSVKTTTAANSTLTLTDSINSVVFSSELSVEAKNILKEMLQPDVIKRAKTSVLVRHAWFEEPVKRDRSN